MVDTSPNFQTAHFSSAGRRRNDGIYRLLSFAVAIAYGAILSQIPTEQFKDYGNYLVYAEQSWPRLLWLLDQGAILALSNEPVWLLINAALSNVLSADATVRTIIFASASTVAYLVLISHPRQFVWLLVFLLLPVVVKNHVIHLRQGLAIAIFLLGWFSQHRVARWLLVVVTPLVHASFFFILLIYFITRAMSHFRLDALSRTVAFVMMGLIMAGGMGWLGALLGARQAQTYQFTMANVSGFGFVMWLSILVLLMLEGRRYLNNYAFEIGVIVFYLSTYWLIEVTARIFESGTLPVLLAGLALTGWRRLAFLGVVTLVLGSMGWLTRIGQPAMGFGIA